jgi:hypothetical protein
MQSVLGAKRGNFLGHRQQEEVMVAQDDNSSITQLLDVTEDAQRIRATVDQIADKPETISTWIKSDVLNQALQGLVTALHIADCVGSHE